ncbi:hypothetical protein QBC47DRAFT_61906 [Echria macrotheca]|uniref:Uncharacterized protein n=1 Tax=Echria macrotheca TaxID=438768 RepID=A0AAJ0B925_9PEZI|nr:hypothetical protein QBC47DRAFT_61906 [Echria macrotheca]
MLKCNVRGVGVMQDEVRGDWFDRLFVPWPVINHPGPLPSPALPLQALCHVSPRARTHTLVGGHGVDMGVGGRRFDSCTAEKGWLCFLSRTGGKGKEPETRSASLRRCSKSRPAAPLLSILSVFFFFLRVSGWLARPSCPKEGCGTAARCRTDPNDTTHSTGLPGPRVAAAAAAGWGCIPAGEPPNVCWFFLSTSPPMLHFFVFRVSFASCCIVAVPGYHPMVKEIPKKICALFVAVSFCGGLVCWWCVLL